MRKNEGMSPSEIRDKWAKRRPEVTNVLQFLSDKHLHPELRQIVTPIRNLAFELLKTLDDGPELTLGLRKLVEAKDTFCRQYLVSHDFQLTPQIEENSGA